MVLDQIYLGHYNGRSNSLWTINGEVFPHTPTFVVEEGDLVKTRIVNRSFRSSDAPAWPPCVGPKPERQAVQGQSALARHRAGGTGRNLGSGVSRRQSGHLDGSLPYPGTCSLGNVDASDLCQRHDPLYGRRSFRKLSGITYYFFYHGGKW